MHQYNSALIIVYLRYLLNLERKYNLQKCINELKEKEGSFIFFHSVYYLFIFYIRSKLGLIWNEYATYLQHTPNVE